MSDDTAPYAAPADRRATSTGDARASTVTAHRPPRHRAAARRALAHRRPARRHGLHVAVQPGLRPPAGRPVRAAHRGHRPGPLPRGLRAAGLRHPALARPHLGRGPRRRRAVRALPPVRAARHLPPLRRPAARRAATPTTAGAPPERLAQMREAAAEGQAAHRLRPALRRQDRRGARARCPASPRRRSCACSSPTTRRSSSTTSSAAGSRRRAPTTRSSSRPTASRPTTWPSSSTTTRWGSPTSCAARSGSPPRPSTSCSTSGSACEPPAFAHMPLLRNTDKSKISKRKNPAARLTWFREQGYLPEALVNFLALLAYPPAEGAEGEDVEVFTLRGVRRTLRLGQGQPGRPDLRPQEARLAQRRPHPRARRRRVRLAAAALPHADGVLGENPSLGELARLRGGRRAHPDPHGAPHRGDRPRRARSSSPTTPSRSPRTPAPSSRTTPGRCSTPPWRRSRPCPTSTPACSAAQRRGPPRPSRRPCARRSSTGSASSRSSPSARCARRCRGARLAAAVRVDGDPRQGLDAGPAAGAARHAVTRRTTAAWRRAASRDLGAGERAR